MSCRKIEKLNGYITFIKPTLNVLLLFFLILKALNLLIINFKFLRRHS